MPAFASSGVTIGFIGLAATVVVLFVVGSFAASRRVGEAPEVAVGVAIASLAGATVWMGLTFVFAASGALARFDLRPPTLGALFVASVCIAGAIGLSGVGDRLARGLPLAALVGAQGFRLPLELVMHRAAREGLIPVQMSFSGYNFDIVTGATAIALAVWLEWGPVPRRVVLAWNVLGIATLTTIVGLAVASTPTLHAFGSDPSALNTFVAYVPFVWLPSVMVVGAIVGHIVITRRLLARGKPERRSRS
ncbi:MAG TPA: hypothetical protein VGM06_20850 [Polyangiaceae bacterium]